MGHGASTRPTQDSRACMTLRDTTVVGTIVWKAWKPPAQICSSALPASETWLASLSTFESVLGMQASDPLVDLRALITVDPPRGIHFEDAAYRVLAVNQSPDHATPVWFRRRQDSIAGLFGQVLGLCVRAGLVDAGVVAIYGTKIAADASFFASRSRKELAAEILEEAEATDAAEHALLGDRSGGELPEEWGGGRDRRDRIRAALDELDRRQTCDYESRMAERAKKETELARKRTGPKPSADTARRARPRRANTTAAVDLGQDRELVIVGLAPRGSSSS